MLAEAVGTVDFDQSVLHVNRSAWRAAVAEIAVKAKATLPDCTGRVDSAVKIVLAGDVELLPDGKANVFSQSNGVASYHLVNGHCECRDFDHPPSGWCKHRIAAGLAKRAQALLPSSQDTPAPAPRRCTRCFVALDAEDVARMTAICSVCAILPAPLSPLSPRPTPAPLPVPDIPAQYLVELHGKPFVTFAGLLQLAHARGLQRLEAHLVTLTTDLAYAEATATFTDGRVFSQAADATPANVKATIRPHFPRMALTRAKARALRDALNIGMCSLEELSE